MKKITLLAIAFFTIISIQAQVKKLKTLTKANFKLETCNENSTPNFENKSDVKNEKSNGIFWSEYFNDGKMPDGWLTLDKNKKGFVWICTNQAPGGQYSSTIKPINSTSGGYFMQLRGDFYNTPYVSGNVVDMNAFFQTSAIDCSDKADVMLSFEHYFRYCCDEDLTHISVFVSNDSINWTEYDVRNGIGTNKVSHLIDTESPLKTQLNITEIAANQPKVWLRWYKFGASHYFWMVDDIELSSLPSNDVKLQDYKSEFYGIGHYSKMPLTQVQDLYFSSDVNNFGKNTQHNIQLNVSISDYSTEVFSENSALIDSMISGQIDSVGTANPFVIPSQIKSYEATLTASQTETDEALENNIAKIQFEVTDSIFARDVKKTTYTGPSRYDEGADGDIVGTMYYIQNDDELNSISVSVSSLSDTLTSIIGKILIDDGSGNLTEAITSEAYEITSKDLGSWVTLPLIKDGTSEFISGDKLVYACIEFYFQGIAEEKLYINADETNYHDFINESYLRIGSSEYYISMVPMIRINVNTQNTPLSAVIKNKTNVSCKLGNDGKAVVAAVGGTAPYTFLWSNGSTNDTISNLIAGTYTVTVKDNTNESQIATVVIEEPEKLEVSGIITNEVTINDGKIDVSVVGGTPAYAYLWNNGNKNPDLENISGGTYVLTVTDKNSCTASKLFVVAGSLGINQVEKSNIRIYPNPTKGNLNITNVENANISIFNIIGKKVMNLKSSDKNIVVDFNKYSEGTYIIQIIKNDKVITEKINYKK
jgi:hypothetical protein